MTVQEAIKSLRASLGGLTQEGLARRMDLTLRTIVRYENDSPPKGPALKRFADLAAAAQNWDAQSVFLRSLANEYRVLGFSGTGTVGDFKADILNARQVLLELQTRTHTIDKAREVGSRADEILAKLGAKLEAINDFAVAFPRPGLRELPTVGLESPDNPFDAASPLRPSVDKLATHENVSESDHSNREHAKKQEKVGKK